MNLIEEYRSFVQGREVDYCYALCGRYHAVFEDASDVTVSGSNITMSSPFKSRSIVLSDTQSNKLLNEFMKDFANKLK